MPTANVPTLIRRNVLLMLVHLSRMVTLQPEGGVRREGGGRVWVCVLGRGLVDESRIDFLPIPAQTEVARHHDGAGISASCTG